MRILVTAVVAALALAACDKGVPKPEKMDPVTMEEAKDLAAAFKAAIVPCDAGRIDALIDFDNLLRRSLQKTDASDEIKRGMAKGAREQGGVGRMLCQSMAADATYELLRIKEVDGQPRPLFRLIANSAVNYHELELGKSKKDHKVRVVDIQIYASGDLLSDTLAQMFQQGVAVMKGGGDAMRAGRTLGEINQARARGDNEEARRLMKTLPDKLRNAKPMRLMDLMGAADLDPTEYGAMMEAYRHDFPGDPSVDMVALDYYYLKKDQPKALAAVEHIDQLVGGDPYLALLRANVYLLDTQPEHLAEAEKWARKAVEAEPGNKNAWWSLVVALLQRGDYVAVLPAVDTLRTRFGERIDPTAMAGNELWTGFFASQAYQDSVRNP